MSEKSGSVNLGLLILRVGIGVMSMYHGWPKLFGGPIAWKSVGMAMAVIGVGFWPTFWGFCAAAAEFIGGACFVMGFVFRPACVFLAFTMFVATMFHFHHGDGLLVASHALELLVVYISLLIIGPGSVAMDNLFRIGKK